MRSLHALLLLCLLAASGCAVGHNGVTWEAEDSTPAAEPVELPLPVRLGVRLNSSGASGLHVVLVEQLRRSPNFEVVRQTAIAEQEGRLEEAERGYRRALSVYLQLARANRSSLRLVRTLSAGYARLASLLSLRGQGAEALRLIDAADRQAASLAKQVPAHVDLARDMAVMRFQHAELQARHGVLPRALELYRGSLEVLSALVERAPHLAPELKQVREQVEAARGHIARFTQEGAPPAEDPSDELAYAQFLAARGEAAAAGQAYLRALAADLEPGDQREALLGAAKAFAPSDPARASEHLSAWSAALEAASQQARAASAATPPHSPQRRSPEREAAERRTRRLLSQREVAARSRELSPLRQEPVWAEVFPPK
ncbi:MAG TPA: hypothetical protein DEA08_18135 [Planctomycetes bacterium]|nr:hypothetical protein [Planctomycetota bacterium]